MADRDDGLARALGRGDDVVRVGARCKPLVDPELDAGRFRDRGCGLSRAQERARDDGVRPLDREALAERPRLLPPARAERAQLVRVAGIGVGVADEDQAHEAGG